MSFRRDFDEWADHYLKGDLDPAKKEEFEQALENEPELKMAFEEHRILAGALKKLGRQSRIRARVKETIKAGSQNSGAPYKWYLRMGAAASIILISIVTTLFTAGYLNQKRQADHFNALKRDVEKMKYNQKVLVSDYNNKVRSTTESYGGTGFLLSNQGYLITNYHVVSSADSIYVSDAEGNMLSAELILASRSYDLAILKLSDTSYASKFKIPYWLAPGDAGLGDRLFTLGYPKDEIVYGEGYLSARSGFRGDTTSWQISMALNPGNSGGPVFTDKGALMGIISGKQNEKEGVAFAVKTEYIRKMADMVSKVMELDIQLPEKPLKALPRNEMIREFEKHVFQVRVYSN